MPDAIGVRKLTDGSASVVLTHRVERSWHMR
jgi:hypothetical protein